MDAVSPSAATTATGRIEAPRDNGTSLGARPSFRAGVAQSSRVLGPALVTNRAAAVRARAVLEVLGLDAGRAPALHPLECGGLDAVADAAGPCAADQGRCDEAGLGG